MQNEIAAAVESFVEKIKETVRQRRAADGAGQAPVGRRMEAAVRNLRERINRALQGKDAAGEIQEAVWQFLRELGIEYPNK